MSTIGKWFLPLLLVLASERVYSVMQAQPETRLASLRVVAFSSGGYYLGNVERVDRFESLHDRTTFASKFNAGMAVGIPFGMYNIHAGSQGFEWETRQVTVSKEQQTIIVGLPIGSLGEGTRFKFRGRIVGEPDTQKSFVRLIGVYLSQTMESDIDAKGEFEMSDLPPGKYLLVVAGEQQILATQLVTIPLGANQPLEIEIGQLTIPGDKW
jgi:hypothetical protein